MGTSGNRDCQRASRSALKDFTDDALTISAGSLFQNGTAQMVKANWRRRVQHRCWFLDSIIFSVFFQCSCRKFYTRPSANI